jgi:hypothetical protein
VRQGICQLLDISCSSTGELEAGGITRVVSQHDATFVQEEYVIDELDRQSFAYAGSQAMHDPGSHEAAKAGRP